MEDHTDLAKLLEDLEQSWSADRSAMLRLTELNHRTSSRLVDLMHALRAARESGAVPVLLSREAVEAIYEVFEVQNIPARAAQALVACEDLARDLGNVIK
jgi:hypothetical protein